MGNDRPSEHYRAFQDEVRSMGTEGGFVRADLDAPVRPTTTLTGRLAIELFESQLLSRCADLAARWLRAQDLGYYTIGSSGHEANVVLGALAGSTDPWLLHYRSGAAVMQRCRGKGGTPIFDLCLSLCAAVDDPVSGGRHKVFGSPDRWILPQTSTIASHLPKAIGTAFAIERARALDNLQIPLAEDAITLCSFGDASLNHSTATGAINAARWARFQHLPLPLLLVCEDNGLGISLATPKGWVEAAIAGPGQEHGNPTLKYLAADGLDLCAAYDAAKEAVSLCRSERRPVFLHLKTVRLFGHAGSDLEQAYRRSEDIQEGERRDPVWMTARTLIENQVMRPAEVADLMEESHARVFSAAEEAAGRARLDSPSAIIGPLPPLPKVEAPITETPGGGQPRHLARLLNEALAETLDTCPEALIFGEDVGHKGGVYGVTRGLQQRFGARRVFSTLLDEQTILGLAIGAGQVGLLPVPEIQYLAYLHNAEDQLRGEAASLSFFSNGRYTNPMVVRIAAFGYQKGFGGHFHNDNSITVLRDIPGIIIAAPARGDDAVRMWRSCVHLAQQSGRVVVFLEPIARYMTRDLHDAGDGLWADPMPPPGQRAAIGLGRCYGADAGDLTLISYANGVFLSLQAARVLEQEHQVRARVFDLRWLAPMDVDGMVEHVRATGQRPSSWTRVAEAEGSPKASSRP